MEAELVHRLLAVLTDPDVQEIARANAASLLLLALEQIPAPLRDEVQAELVARRAWRFLGSPPRMP